MDSKGYQIVIAEDNAADLLMMKLALREAVAKFELSAFEDGSVLLDYLAEHRRNRVACPDLMILDLNMPKIGGLEVIRRLREGAVCPATPVVVLTSSSHPKDHEVALQFGAARYLLKPEGYNEFLEIGRIIKSMLEETCSQTL